MWSMCGLGDEQIGCVYVYVSDVPWWISWCIAWSPNTCIFYRSTWMLFLPLLLILQTSYQLYYSILKSLPCCTCQTQSPTVFVFVLAPMFHSYTSSPCLIIIQKPICLPLYTRSIMWLESSPFFPVPNMGTLSRCSLKWIFGHLQPY